MKKSRFRFHIGLRTVKTAAAVIIAMMIVESYGATTSKIIFAMLGAMAAVQPTFKDSLESCLTQITGVIFGALAGLLLIILLYSGATMFTTTELAGFAPEFDQAASGLEVGDRILSINGERIYQFNDLNLLLGLGNGEHADLTVERNGQKIAKFNALNDVVISCTSFKRMVDLELFVDNVKINEYSADGVILSTPTGSTAYSLSAGGPVIDSSLDVTVITPICPHLLAVRPVIVPSEKTIKVRIKEKTNRHSMLTIDGQEGFDLEHGDVIKVTNSNYKTTLIKLSDKSFYDVLKYKLSEKPKKNDF